MPALPPETTAEDRAEYIVQRLEQFIREGRKDEQGMSFDKWKNMARSEIAVALAEVEMTQHKDELSSKRVLFVAGAAMVTIGFWGTAVSLNQIAYLTGALVCGGAGLLLLFVAGEWRLRGWREMRQARKRRAILGRIESLNRRIKRLEKELDAEANELEELLGKARRKRAALSIPK